jgi:acyl carrier protein
MEVVPVGVAGELYVGGECLARGYQGRAEQTAERFVPHPFSQRGGARLYRTGDVVRYAASGELEYLGRRDEQVKVRGYRIELGEIEALLRGHERVGEAVVEAKGETPVEVRLVAYLVMREGRARRAVDGEAEAGTAQQAELTPEEEGELRRYVSERLPEYMRPAIYVGLAELPLTPNGKVDRRALPAPVAGRRMVEQEYVAPRTEEEEVLAAIWAEVLGVERVGVFDNFFALGGHSLLATQVVSRVREVFQLEIRIRSLFEMTTVASLAETIVELRKEQQGKQISHISRIERADDEQLAERLDELSDEEVNAMLNDLSLEAESE